MNRIKLAGALATTGLLTLSSWAKAADRPNILFIIADDASMRSFGAYGGSTIETPAFDTLARNGAIFKNAFNCNPKCAPARATLVTGRYSWQLEEACNHWPDFPEKFKFYPSLLEKTGYRIGLTGKGWGPGVYHTQHNPAGPAFDDLTMKTPAKMMRPIDYSANFASFLDEQPAAQPFCFWLGTYEPHRAYEKGAWKRTGMKLSDAVVPPFLPDNDEIRGDLLDYANEVSWFDMHIGRAVDALKKRDMLKNTLIIVTSDHGMPFPRIKGQIYEEGIHIPMIAYWQGVIQPGRVIEDFVNFPDVAPTFMEAAGLTPHEQMTGKSFLNVLKAKKSGQIDPSRTYALLGKERHDIGRASKDGTNLAYPVRAIRTKDFLYVHNIKPELWPVGNPEFGLRNCDPSPSKEYLTALNPEDREYHFYEECFAKRPEEALYHIGKDPDCMSNLATHPEYAEIKAKLRKKMEQDLTDQKDPRTLGFGEIFDTYKYTGRQFDYTTGQPVKKTK